MKTYVLTLSQVFPATHPRKGEPTNFKVSLLNALYIHNPNAPIKEHTIRGNYELWRKRFEEIDAGNACLSIREWSGKPYQSKQVEIARLTKADGINLQKLTLKPSLNCCGTVPGEWHQHGVPEDTLAKNDGLSYEDWKAWFKNSDFSKPFALIHFTKGGY